MSKYLNTLLIFNKDILDKNAIGTCAIESKQRTYELCHAIKCDECIWFKHHVTFNAHEHHISLVKILGDYIE